MSVEYHINTRDALITLTFKGTVRAAEAGVGVDEMLNDPEFDADLPQLVDMRTAELAGSDEELERLETYLLGEFRQQLNACVAIVVNPDWDEPTCAKAFWLACALQHAELFDNWNQACKWLIKREFDSPIDAITQDLDALVEDVDQAQEVESVQLPTEPVRPPD